MRQLKTALFLSLTSMLIVGTAMATQTDHLSLGRTAIAEQQWETALDHLHQSIAGASGIADSEIRGQALKATEFFAAVAHTGAGELAEARQHVELFFDHAPLNTAIDRGVYGDDFVDLFDHVRDTLVVNPASEFDELYEPFRFFAVEHPVRTRPESWEDSTAYILLATNDEKREFSRLETAEEKIAFIEHFWHRRDPDPAKPGNAFRDQFFARVDYADEQFYDDKEFVRGSITDRGRVFSLLGKPRAVRTRPMQEKDGKFGLFRSVMETDASVEVWAYFRDQLPTAIPKRHLEFTFVTQEQFGLGRLDRSTFNVRVMGAAAEAAILRE